MDIIENIGAKLVKPISTNDIEICHRVAVANSFKRYVIVHFIRRSKRNAVLEKARRFRSQGTDVGLRSDMPYLQNEHLCHNLKRLLAKTTSEKRETRLAICLG